VELFGKNMFLGQMLIISDPKNRVLNNRPCYTHELNMGENTHELNTVLKKYGGEPPKFIPPPPNAIDIEKNGIIGRTARTN